MVSVLPAKNVGCLSAPTLITKHDSSDITVNLQKEASCTRLKNSLNNRRQKILHVRKAIQEVSLRMRWDGMLNFQAEIYDDPHHFLVLGPKNACTTCRNGDWACALGFITITGRQRSEVQAVKVGCIMCPSNCSIREKHKSLPHSRLMEILAEWKTEEQAVTIQRNAWFEGGQDPYHYKTTTSSNSTSPPPQSGFDSRKRCASSPPPSPFRRPNSIREPVPLSATIISAHS